MEAAALLGARVTPVGPVWMGGMTQYEKCVDVQPGAKGLVGSRLHLGMKMSHRSRLAAWQWPQPGGNDHWHQRTSARCQSRRQSRRNVAPAHYQGLCDAFVISLGGTSAKRPAGKRVLIRREKTSLRADTPTALDWGEGGPPDGHAKMTQKATIVQNP